MAKAQIIVDSEKNFSNHVEQERLRGKLTQVMHRADRLEESTDICVGDVAAQVLLNLVLIERKEGEDEGFVVSLMVCLVVIKEGCFILEGPKVLSPAG